MSKYVGLVLSAEYFPHTENQTHPLELVMRDSEVRDAVSGIWVPGYMIRNYEAMTEIVGIASGRRFIDYTYCAPEDPYDEDDHGESLATSGHENLKATKVIINACVDGGTSDVVHQVEQLLTDYRVKNTVITLSPSIRDVGVNGIKKAFEGEEGISFYMVATYPEDTEAGVEEFNGVKEAHYTKHISELVDAYGLEGIVAFAGLSKSTSEQQKLLAMGVTSRGVGYDSSVKSRKSAGSVYKRSRTPGQTLEGASFNQEEVCNTELLLGRAMTSGRTNGESPVEIPKGILWESDQGMQIIQFMKENILRIRDKAREAVSD